MRVSQGGHDVPTEKLRSRHPRTLANLKAAIRELPHILVFDNNDPHTTFRQVAVFENGKRTIRQDPLPRWLTSLLK